MKLTHDYYYRPSAVEKIIFARQHKAATKIWNQGNYERYRYKEYGRTNLFEQRKRIKHQDLLAQSNQEVLRELDATWRGYFAVNSSTKKHVEMPGFRRRPSAVCYLKDCFRYYDDTLRLSIPKALKKKYSLDYIYIQHESLRGLSSIKLVRVSPIKNGLLRIAIVHEVPDVGIKPDNEKYLSIDLGFNRLMCCYTNIEDSFILGKGYADNLRYFDKLMKKAEADFNQSRRQGDRRKSSNKMKKIADKKANYITDKLHKCTKQVVKYCVEHDINTVVVGKIKRIHDKFVQENSALRYNWPYGRMYELLRYKLQMTGVKMEIQVEFYTSSCSPLANNVCAANAHKENRIGSLYRDGKNIWNADVVGAFNILRLYLERIKKSHIELPIKCLSKPRTIKII